MLRVETETEIDGVEAEELKELAHEPDKLGLGTEAEEEVEFEEVEHELELELDELEFELEYSRSRCTPWCSRRGKTCMA